MAKISIKKLVSLILEQLNTREVLDKLFPPNKNVFVDDLNKYPELFEPVEVENEPEVEKPIRQLQPEPEMEPELQMVAEMAQKREYEEEILEEVMYIPAAEVTAEGTRGLKEVPKIICKDPETGEMVEDMVISNRVLITPNGRRVLLFVNYGLDQKVDRLPYKENYIVLADTRYNEPGKRFIGNKPRGEDWGKFIPREVRKEMANEVPGESEEEKKAREERVETIYQMMGKRYNIFPSVNEMFANPEVLDHLDKCLIPETWATSTRTEHTWNVQKFKKFAGTSPEIDVDFISVRDISDVESAINDVMDLREMLAMGGEEGETINRERETSSHIPRQHANYIYAGGKWEARQRVHDPNFFERAGGKTPVYQLLSKNIQEGLKQITIESKLEIQGAEREGTEYIMVATFSSKLNARNSESGKGQDLGNLFEPITVQITKPIPNGESVNIEDNPRFFIDQGRTTAQVPKTGFVPDVLSELGQEIVSRVDPDDVLERMIQLVQTAVDNEPEAALAEQKINKAPRKIKLTESQLKKVVNIISEETYDQALTTHLREKEREVFMSREDAKLMSILATNWCENRVNHPDCEELMSIIKKTKIDKI